jgi:hypothetical protein
MKWSDIPRNPSHRVLRQFAGAWLVFFLAWAAYQGLVKSRVPLGIGLAILAVAVGIVGLIRPGAVRWLFVGWMILAFPIGWLISQLTLLLMFFGIITPFALFFRIIGRDPLRRKEPPGTTSYWTVKEQPADPRRYFRQY